MCNNSRQCVWSHFIYYIYMGPLKDIIRKHGLPFHHYEDNLQLYSIFKPMMQENLIVFKWMLEACLSEIMVWIAKHILKLNYDKTGFKLLMSTNIAKNLGVIFDIYMWMNKHRSIYRQTQIRMWTTNIATLEGFAVGPDTLCDTG